jgi:ribosome-binding protein aMBF1 (putative translation factor)
MHNVSLFQYFLNEQYKNKPKELTKMNKEAEKLIVIGDVIQDMVKIRIDLGINQTEIAQKMDVKKSFISRIERGDVDFRISTLIKYLKALGKKINLK